MNIDKWLDEPINNINYDIITNKYISLTSNIQNYYLPTNSEILNQNEKDIYYYSYGNFIGTQKYDDIKQRQDHHIVLHIPHNTRRYELDNIFRRLIDACIKDNIYEDDENSNDYLISPVMRESFYDFVNKIDT